MNNPEEFGIVEFDLHGNGMSLTEKSVKPKSNYAIPGLNFYDNRVIDFAKDLKPSSQEELEITDLNRKYLEIGKLKVMLLGRGFAWLDTGTYEGLANATEFVRTIQNRQGLYISCIEEIAYKMGFIDKAQLLALSKDLIKTDYGKYLLNLANSDQGR